MTIVELVERLKRFDKLSEIQFFDEKSGKYRQINWRDSLDVNEGCVEIKIK